MHGRNAALIRRFFPGYQPPGLRYQAVLDQQVGPETVWLELGCGKRICKDEKVNHDLPERARLVVGVDLDPGLSRHTSIRNLVRCDAAALPFRDGVFTLVSSSMVLEHLEHPDVVFAEIARVCARGGRFVAFTPNLLNYGMLVSALTPYRFHLLYKKLTYYFARGEWCDHEEDMFLTWYRANSVGRLRRLVRQAEFQVERLERLSMAHSFGFVRPLYAASLLFERLIDRPWLNAFKADILGVFVRGNGSRGRTGEDVSRQQGAARAARSDAGQFDNQRQSG
jgi:ubiquinone/menaquinone biosynthesis C-methylase UbiE